MCIEEPGQLIEPYEIRMMEHRSIPCLLPVQTAILEGRRRYLYDISGKQQFADYFSGKKIGCHVLRMFLFSVQQMCGSLSEYLLREEGICLEFEFVYVNLEDGSLQFTYLPFYEKSLQESFQLCMEQLLRKIDHQDKMAVELGYHLYQLCTGDNANIGKLLEMTLGKQLFLEKDDTVEKVRRNAPKIEQENEKDRETEEKAMDDGGKKLEYRKRQLAMGKNFLNRKTSDVAEKNNKKFFQKKWKVFCDNLRDKGWYKEFLEKYFPECCKIIARIKRKQKKKKQGNFQELSEVAVVPKEEHALAHPTEILGVRQKGAMGKLVYHGVHQCEDILLVGESFLLGKNGDQVDGVILAEGVSRLHAKITRRDDNYFIEDLNSTNGTYLNDVMLEYHQPKQLTPKDKVRFGVEEYVFF